MSKVNENVNLNKDGTVDEKSIPKNERNQFPSRDRKILENLYYGEKFLFGISHML